jgi:putative NIF3 family GTP cyclohydrolase 1 type 2
MTVRLADVIATLEAAYPPGLAQDWDAVGLVCGDPDDVVASILVAVDPVPETVDETLETGAQLLLTHHPLLLRGVHGVGADTPKGALVHRLVRGGAALFTAHTNADAANPGVSDALAHAIGVTVDGPLEAAPGRRSTRS